MTTDYSRKLSSIFMAAKHNGLTIKQFEILVYMGSIKKGTYKDISLHFNTTPPTFKHTNSPMQCLIKAGFVKSQIVHSKGEVGKGAFCELFITNKGNNILKAIIQSNVSSIL